MSEIKLKPCPFCGNEAKARVTVVRGMAQDHIKYCVYCQECGIEKYCAIPSGISSGEYDKMKYKVIEDWNRRADEK